LQKGFAATYLDKFTKLSVLNMPFQESAKEGQKLFILGLNLKIIATYLELAGDSAKTEHVKIFWTFFKGEKAILASPMTLHHLFFLGLDATKLSKESKPLTVDICLQLSASFGEKDLPKEFDELTDKLWQSGPADESVAMLMLRLFSKFGLRASSVRGWISSLGDTLASGQATRYHLEAIVLLCKKNDVEAQRVVGQRLHDVKGNVLLLWLSGMHSLDNFFSCRNSSFR
jgi:hypothetical protein